jgi:hypothetical protein
MTDRFSRTGGSVVDAATHPAFKEEESEGLVKPDLIGMEVEGALRDVAQSKELAELGLKLQSAVLTLEEGFVIDAVFELNIVIFTIKWGEKKTRTSTTTLTFGTMPAGTAATRRPLDMKEALRRAIHEGAQAAGHIKVLPLSEAKFKVDFAVEETVGGGIKFVILGAQISGDIDLEKTSENSLEVTFTRGL